MRFFNGIKHGIKWLQGIVVFCLKYFDDFKYSQSMETVNSSQCISSTSILCCTYNFSSTWQRFTANWLSNRTVNKLQKACSPATAYPLENLQQGYNNQYIRDVELIHKNDYVFDWRRLKLKRLPVMQYQISALIKNKSSSLGNKLQRRTK